VLFRSKKQKTYGSSPADPTYNPTHSDGTPVDIAELQAIIDAWPDLPVAVRAGIVAMVSASCTH